MKKSVKPIKPSDMAAHKAKIIPPEVIEAFNELITENFNGGYAKVVQKDVVALIVKKGLKEDDVYDKGWLYVEGVFGDIGWKVEYDKPGYCESYDAYFVFSAK